MRESDAVASVTTVDVQNGHVGSPESDSRSEHEVSSNHDDDGGLHEGIRSRSPGREHRQLDQTASDPHCLPAAADAGGVMEQGGSWDPQGFQPGTVAGQPPLVPLTGLHAQQLVAYAHSGPLPDPQTLANYGEIDATFPERIMRMAEVEIETRAHVLTRTANAEAFGVRMGVITAAVVPVALAVLGLVLVLNGLGTGYLFVIPGVLVGVAQIISAVRGNAVSSGNGDSTDE